MRSSRGGACRARTVTSQADRSALVRVVRVLLAECQTRFSNCLKCSEAECLTCNEETFLSQGTCYKCTAISTGCQRCELSGSTGVCTQCGKGFKLVDGKCQSLLVVSTDVQPAKSCTRVASNARTTWRALSATMASRCSTAAAFVCSCPTSSHAACDIDNCGQCSTHNHTCLSCNNQFALTETFECARLLPCCVSPTVCSETLDSCQECSSASFCTKCLVGSKMYPKDGRCHGLFGTTQLTPRVRPAVVRCV